MELHPGAVPVDAGVHRGSESVDAGHRVQPADEQRQPLPGHGVGPHEVRGRGKAEQLSGLSDAFGRQVVPLARRQMGGAVAHTPDYAFGQQVAQGSVDCGVRLAENKRQLRRIDERRSAKGVEQLSFGEGHMLRVAKESPDGQPSRVSVGV